MPQTKLYFEAKEELKDVFVDLTNEQETKRAQDQEIINAMDNYYNPYRERWRQNGALFNVIQQGVNDPVSNWYLGWARLLINHSVAMTSAGSPEGSFTPPGPSDERLKVLWEALVKHYLNKCKWPSQQRRWNIDLHVTGNGVLKAYNEVKVRKDGNQFRIDRAKSKTGLRAVSPFKCMRSIWIADPDDVRIGVQREGMSWNQFVGKYANVEVSDGKKTKYKYDTSQVPVGYNVQLTHIFDEDANEYRIYALSYGRVDESSGAHHENTTRELGLPIYSIKLKKSEIHGEGLNIQGLAPLSFALFEDQLDINYETHSIVGMGIPQIIEGPESIMQQLVNQTIENVELKNTVPLSYEPLDPENPSYIGVDATQLRSSMFIDGKISAHPLGVADVGSNTVLWEWLKQLMFQLTGINPEGITGDGLKTAYQSGLLVRQMNLRAKDRTTAWENGCLTRAWGLLLDYALSDSTIKDWTSITEKQAEEIVQRIGGDEMTGEDFDEKRMEKRVIRYFPVPGYNFKESFKGKNRKVRTMDESTSNTLVGGKGKAGDISFVPMDAAYLLPTGDIEDILEFDVHVSGKNMLFDLKTQDMQQAREFLTMGVSLKQAIPDIDLRKQYVNAGKIAGYEEEELMTEKKQKSKRLQTVEAALGETEIETENPTLPISEKGAPQTPQKLIEDLAAGNA